MRVRGSWIEAEDRRCRLVIPIIHSSTKLSYHRSVRQCFRATVKWVTKRTNVDSNWLLKLSIFA